METAPHDTLRNWDATFSLKDVEWENIRGHSCGEVGEIGRRELFLLLVDSCEELYASEFFAPSVMFTLASVRWKLIVLLSLGTSLLIELSLGV